MTEHTLRKEATSHPYIVINKDADEMHWRQKLKPMIELSHANAVCELFHKQKNFIFICVTSKHCSQSFFNVLIC